MPADGGMKKIDFPKNSSVVLGRTDHSTHGYHGGELCVRAPERILLDKRFSLGMRALACWIWGQSLSWVFRVEDIQARLGITRAAWRTLAREMADAGFMRQDREPVPGSVPIHTITFNFSIFEGKQGSPQASHSGVRTREGRKTTTHATDGIRPLVRGADYSQETKYSSNPKTKVPPPGGGHTGIQADSMAVALARRLGLNEAETARFTLAVKGAAQEQIELIELIYANTKRVNNPVALAIGLAKQAAAGTLKELTSADSRRKSESDVVRLLKLLNGHDGALLADPSGPIARVEAGRLRSLRDPGTPCLHPKMCATLVARWQAGELDLLPPDRLQANTDQAAASPRDAGGDGHPPWMPAAP